MDYIAEMKDSAYIQKLRAAAARNEKIRLLCRGGASQSDVARLYGISRQRVHQVVTRPA